MIYAVVRGVLTAGVSLVLCACVEGSNTDYAGGQYAPTDPKKIEVIQPVGSPHKYVVLGSITENPMADKQASLADAKQRAAKMGADAITVPTLTPGGYWVQCLAVKYTD